jgi:TolB protein
VVAGAQGRVGAGGAAPVTRVGCCDADPAWSPSGDRLAFARRGTIHTVGIDGSAPRYLASGHQPAWSPDGARIAYGVSACPDRYTGCYTELLSDAVAGGPSATLRDRTRDGSYLDPTWSPDGHSVAYSFVVSQAQLEVRVIGADGTGDRLLTPGIRPAWSPRGDWIAFSDTHDLYVIRPDGTGRRRLTSDAGGEDDPSWSPDGTRLVFNGNSSGRSLLYTIRLDGSGETAITSGGNDIQPAWSPDGKTIAFVSDRGRAGVAPSTIFLLDLGSTTLRPYAPTVEYAGTGARCTIEGTDSSENLVGTAGADVVCGLWGRDVIQGLGGNDVIDGGVGADRIDGGTGNDVLLGDLNSDRIQGGAGNDRIVGGTGVDLLLGGAGADSIDARDHARDVVDGGPGRDSARVDAKFDKVLHVERVRRF